MIKKVDATTGNTAKLIFIYAIPLILSTILQSLFDVADKAVLGNMAGPTAVASIGATGTVSGLIINGAVGLSTGTAIVLARFIGAKKTKEIRTTIDTSLITAFVFGLIVALAGFFLAPFFLRVTDCPAECYDGALLYMRLLLAAAPATLLYNYGSAILRSFGDTQRPLIYVTVAGVLNVVMNVILCLVLPQKVLAVALATILSKIVSAALVLRRLCRAEDVERVQLSKMHFDWEAFKRIFRFGIPASISALVVPLGNLQIITAINSYGAQAMAGQSAAVSIENFVYAVVNGFSSAALTFIGQNVGANKVDRVRKSFRYCLLFNFFIAGSLGALLYLSGKFWIGLVIGKTSTAAIGFGMSRLRHVALFVFLHAIGTILTSTLKAFGYPMLTSITNIVFNLGFRVFWMQFIYPLNPVYSTIMLCFPVSWALNLLFYTVFTVIIYRRYVKKGICKKI